MSGNGVASAYIDLATYDQLEKYLYGGCYAVTPFVREVTKSTWFSLIPARLTTTGGSVNFGNEFSANISRAGDYMTQNWLRVTLPAVSYSDLAALDSNLFTTATALAVTAWRPYNTGQGRTTPAAAVALRWTRNLMHNLVKQCSITFNDLIETQFSSSFLDFWAAFTVPKDKRVAYDTMIGNVAELFDPLSLDAFQLGPTGTAAGTVTLTAAGGTGTTAWTSEVHLGPNALGLTGANVGGLNSIGTLTGTGSNATGILAGPLKGRYLPSKVLNLPLPLPHARNSGVALPTAALPYNDMKINFQLRDAWDLLLADIYDASSPGNTPAFPGFTINVSQTAAANLTLTGHVWAEYAVVSNAERSRMGCHPRDILIEQQQEAARQTINTLTTTFTQDLRYSHAVRAIFFAFKNTTLKNEHSNYTAAVPVPFPDGVNFAPYYAVDPIESTSLLYEGTTRLDTLTADYYSLVNPYYHSNVVAEETGYHLYAYAIDIAAFDPCGSTNMGKLSNVSMNYNLSEAATTTLASASTNPTNLPMARGTTPRLTTGSAFLPADWYWGNTYQSQFEVKNVVVNHQIVRISGGVLAFPVL